MTRIDVERLVGTVLMVLGLGVCVYAGVVGVFAVGAEAFGAERSQIMLLAITATLWLLAGVYHISWGHYVREGFRWP